MSQHLRFQVANQLSGDDIEDLKVIAASRRCEFG
jgi:hypothetical protein